MAIPFGSVQYKRACYVRRPEDFRLPEPGRRRPGRSCLHDPEQGPGFREWYVSYVQTRLARYGLDDCLPARSLRLESTPDLVLVP